MYTITSKGIVRSVLIVQCMLKSTDSNTVLLHNIMHDDYYVRATKLVSYQGTVVLHSMMCVKFHLHPAAILDTGTEKDIKTL